MGDFQLTWPGPRRPSLLGDYQLHLDPQIEAEIRAIAARQNFERLGDIWLRREWWRLEPVGAGPDTPRPGEVSDVLKAIWAVPAVQSTAYRLLDEATSNLRLGVRRAPT